MKKLLLSLSVALCSIGVFANASLIENEALSQNKEITLKKEKCQIKTTTTVTINHGTYTETITIVTYHPC